MENGKSHKSAATAPQRRDSAEPERIAAAITLTLRGTWLQRNFLPVLSANGRVSKMLFPANVRDASCFFRG